MAAPLSFELTTPERVVLTQEADSVTIPTKTGEITVLPNHVPLVSLLASGVMTVRKGGEESYIAVTGGFLEVHPGSRLVILADTADRAEELDRAAAERARATAAKVLSTERAADDVSSAAAVAALEHELSRFKALERFRGRRKAGPSPHAGDSAQ